VNVNRRTFLTGASALALAGVPLRALAEEPVIEIASPMAPPEWALLQRRLLAANTEACIEFYNRYFDERGYILAFLRWGANDGPDDAIENVNNWPLLHSLGAPDLVYELYRKAWEGHLRQFTEARTTQIEYAREGMYFREFPTIFDWQHHSEFLSVFNLMGLSNPYDNLFRQRARRYAGFYMGTDPTAPNYDPQHRIIRSMFTGSRGPLLRPTTTLDWAGEPFEVAGRFQMEHGERSYEETLAHYREYGDTVGDSPLNLASTTLALNAYMLEHEAPYRNWLLSYVDAWVERARANHDILPSKIGLDGRIGGPEGKWYGGTYGWAFSPIVPQTGEREHRNRVPRSIVAFMNAYLLTGDDKYLDVWRRQNAAINAQARSINGQVQTPRMYGDEGWYGYAAGPYQLNTNEIWYMSMRADDRRRAAGSPWIDYLDGRNPDYPVAALRSDLERVRARVQAQRDDPTTPDTRLVDNALDINPASVTALIQLMEGGIHIARPPWSSSSPATGGAPLFARLRYFDPVARRAGIPPDVSALVETMSADSTTVTLVNTSQSESRTVEVQGGAYGEHRILSVATDAGRHQVDAPSFRLRLAPGAGARLTLAMRRYANQPSLDFPWLRRTVRL
jgi:hypothetical protein